MEQENVRTEREPLFKLDRVGSDTELFLRDKKTKQIVSAVGMVGGNKHEPRPVLDVPGFAVQEDNVMVEFNIPAAKDALEFANNIQKILAYLGKSMHEKGFNLAVLPAAELPVEQLDNPQARQIGCEPDYCVWSRAENVVKLREAPIRSCGGHVHISFTCMGKEPSIIEMEPVVKFADIFLGLPSLWLDRDTERKKLYGKAGAFRPKTYGIEYRVLSNFWIRNRRLTRWVFESVKNMFDCMNSFGDLELVDSITRNYGSSVREAIDNSDFMLAALVLHEFPQVTIPIGTQKTSEIINSLLAERKQTQRLSTKRSAKTLFVEETITFGGPITGNTNAAGGPAA